MNNTTEEQAERFGEVQVEDGRIVSTSLRWPLSDGSYDIVLQRRAAPEPCTATPIAAAHRSVEQTSSFAARGPEKFFCAVRALNDLGWQWTGIEWKQPSAPEPVPPYRGYALLGSGQYIINHSRAGDEPELAISIATAEQMAGRTIGDHQDNPPGSVVLPESMAVRLGFQNVAGLDALEKQLHYLRTVHFPTSSAALPAPREAAREQLSYADRTALVERFRVACRALVKERKVFAEDVATLSEVLRTLEAELAKSAPVYTHPAPKQRESAQEPPAFWLAVTDDGEVVHSYNADDGNNGEAARTELNDWINRHLDETGYALRLVPVYTRPAPLRPVTDEDVEALVSVALEHAGLYVIGVSAARVRRLIRAVVEADRKRLAGERA